jgi:hydroxymethylpyrimidine pyrophosphatase-like HAD family hydrolase
MVVDNRQVIVSGVGDWRYVDCISEGGGKLASLEWVRRKSGIPKERCCACGDSGNDVLMLEGENPAIVVGNAQPDLVEWVLNQPQTGRVVLSHAKGAKGILEGLASLALY